MIAALGRGRRRGGDPGGGRRAVLPDQHAAGTLALTRVQLDALVLGMPWQRIGEAGVITVL